MSDKLNTLNHYDDEAEFFVYARVLQAENKKDKKGDPFWSLKLQDDTGTAWMKAFKAHNLQVGPGDVVKTKAKVNIWKGKRGLQCWGDDVQVVQGAPPPPAQRGSGEQAPPTTEGFADRRVPTAEEVVRQIRVWDQMLTHREIPGEALNAIFGGLIHGIKEGTIRLHEDKIDTRGLSDGGEEEDWPESPGAEDSDDSIPF